MDISSQNPSPTPTVGSNPIQVVPKVDTVVNKEKKIRLLILVTLLFLAFVITYSLIAKQREEQQEKTKSVTKPKLQQSSVVPKKEYKNPFDKNAQYVNPFSQYKNPFDSLK